MIRLPTKMQKPPEPDSDDDAIPLDMRSLARLGLWGGAAAAALLIVAIASHTDAGQRRLAASSHGGNANIPVATLDEERRMLVRNAEIENRRLSDQLRVLAEDRDRLLVRMTALERNYDDVTGSLTRLNKPQPSEAKAAAPAAVPAVAAPPAPAAPTPEIAPVASVPVAPERVPPQPAQPAPQPQQVAAPISAPPATPAPQPAPVSTPAQTASLAPTSPEPPQQSAAPEIVETVPTRTEFGVDLGGAQNVAALRNSWERIRRSHSSTLEGLRPVIGIRDGRSGQVELRLVIGPISNAANAAKLCATLAMSGLSCQPTTFEGQRLALR